MRSGAGAAQPLLELTWERMTHPKIKKNKKKSSHTDAHTCGGGGVSGQSVWPGRLLLAFLFLFFFSELFYVTVTLCFVCFSFRTPAQERSFHLATVSL